ncbi:MAG: cysteine desulfurase [Chlorogloea purpurea SAG 13.99]|nr:cysteine desulfurase [Chlorogloea purpurea SAG 13.99]
MQIYLDYSATTPPREEVVMKVQEILTRGWGNPSSLHHWGQTAATIVETARQQVAGLINAPSPGSIVFTSSGTEANNLAISGAVRRYSTPGHIITSSVEHSAIGEPTKELQKEGWELTRLSVNPEGRIDPKDLKAAIQPNTVLISIIYGQSEVGTVQPIEELAQIAHNHGILFHTDAVQVAGRIPLDVQRVPVDLLSLSSHKIYGIQGAGALYVRPGIELVPLLRGGGQENRLRSGTQAVAAIGAFGMAADLIAAEMATETPRLISLRDRLFDRLSHCPHLKPTGDRLYRLPHHVSFVLTTAGSITGKTLVRALNLAGIGISAGAACNSGKLNPSPVLLAMGYKPQQALTGIRLTLGRDTVEADIDWTAMVLEQILDRCLADFSALPT